MTSQYSIRRVDAVLKVIGQLKSVDFPYEHSKHALEKVESHFQKLKLDIERSLKSDSPDLSRNTCAEALEQTFVFLPILGFILRSTDIGNAFELHGPLLRLARTLLGDNIKLIISSEWEYSPYTYLPIPQLDQFVLIGLPSPESANPLVFPLAGHELGHTLWRYSGHATHIKPAIAEGIINDIKSNRWDEYVKTFPSQERDRSTYGDHPTDMEMIAPASAWAERQAEEVFCDLIGLRLFGKAYIHALTYFLAPGFRTRLPHYPRLSVRFRCLSDACHEYGINKPEQFADIAAVAEVQSDPTNVEKFMVSLADTALDRSTTTLMQLARHAAEDAGIKLPDDEEIDHVVETQFKKGVPARGQSGLANILNAGWRAFQDKDMSTANPNITNYEDFLKELVLKSIEVFEIENRTAN